MSINIRPFKNEEFDTIQKWYIDSGVNAPFPGMLVEDGTFVVEIEGNPVLCQTVLLPQSKTVAYLEYLIKNPEYKDLNVENILIVLREYIEEYVKPKGYQYLLTYGNIDKLKDKYERIGFTPSISNLTAFYRKVA